MGSRVSRLYAVAGIYMLNAKPFVSGFFLRILLSVWSIIVVTGLLTALSVKFLPSANIESKRYDAQLVALVAADLKDFLQDSPSSAIDVILTRHVLDFDQLMQIYIIDPNGIDILSRSLHPEIAALVDKRPIEDYQNNLSRSKLQVYARGLDGYMVIGYQSGFSFGRVLIKPGARLTLLLLAIFSSVIVAWWLSRFITLPVRQLRIAGQKVADGDLAVRVSHTVSGRSDDIAQLARDFDVMTFRVQQLLQSQQHLMRDVSHELRSPLARLQALLSIVRQRENVSSDQLDKMDRELHRLDNLIGQILSYARLQSLSTIECAAIDIGQVLDDIVEDATLEADVQSKQVLLLPLPVLPTLYGDESLLRGALDNIVRNAVSFTKKDSTVSVQVQLVAPSIRISVQDQGCGVPEEAIAHLFDPFFQLREARAGLNVSGGVGLAIAKRAVDLHKGNIKAYNLDRGGLCVEIKLPLQG